ncbi:MAG: hypothetical protein K9J16_03835 [Melioribacteraceae bacterium]|nr:hypothetical protein [Melioribacteraceae bacterium]MCF8354245.1 hypothetical protein [Melioribacteraceae bacterium]MCF8394809.1 hypothetical protein [Melioribacteraceae bacterium]MCF8417976.1 hypothetical protein [Melioribacteraceae bacterium]
MLRFCILALITSIVISVSSNGQVSPEGSPLTVNDGLSQNSANKIFQDSKGFIWICTNDGLNKYNGYDFEIFKNDISSKNTLSGNLVNCILEDSNDNLWIGTGRGISRFNLIENKFTHNLMPSAITSMLINKQIISMLLDNSGILWLGTGDGIFRIDITNNTLVQDNFNGVQLSLLKDNTITEIIQDSDGDIWIGTITSGLFKYYPSSQQLSQIDLHQLKPVHITSLVELSQGIIVIATYGEGIFVYDNNTNKSKWVKSIIDNYNGYILQLLKYNDNEVLAACRVGVFLFDAGNNRLSNVWGKAEESVTLSILIDWSNVLWISTDGYGIYRQNISSKEFFTISKRTLKEKGISFPSVRTFLVDDSNRLWVGGHKGLNVIDYPSLYQGDFTVIKDFNDFNVYSIIQDPYDKNIFWIGTERNGLIEFNYRNGKYSFAIIKNKKNIKSPTEFYKSIVTSKGLIYFGTELGVIVYNPYSRTHSQFIHDINNPGETLIDGKIKALYEDTDRNIWAGSDRDGFSIIDQTTGKITSFKSGNSPFSLSANRINCFYEDKNGMMWIGAENGLNKFIQGENIFEVFNIKNGFANDYIYGILEDDNGNFWLSTNGGIIKFNPVTKVVINFDYTHGLQSNEFNTCAYYKSKTGEIFFGGVSGFTSFFPGEIKLSNYQPEVIYTEFRKNNKDVDLNKSISYSDNVDIYYDDRFFSFGFISTDYNNPHKVKFKYLLDGFDDTWIYTQPNERRAYFTNIDPGEYTLRVEASNSDGIWSGKETVMKIIVHPAFWQTWWFKLLIVSSLFTVVFLLYNSRISRLKREKDIQRDLTNKLINSQEEERKNISYELHDELGQNLLVVKNKLLMSRRENNYENNINLILDILDESVNDVSNISHLLHPSELDAVGLSQTIELMIYRIESASKFKIINDLNPLDQFFLKDEKINVFRIIQEALNNIVKHSGATEVIVSSVFQRGKLTLSIKDNGKGFDKQILTEDKKRPHLGIRGMNERVAMLNGKLKINSSKEKGTEIYIEFPNRKEN